MNTQDESLQDLLRLGKVRYAPGREEEFTQLLQLGRCRLIDARIDHLAAESRFDLAYSACNVLTLAAFRWKGLRPNTSIPLLLLLPYLMPLDSTAKHTLAKSYEVGNSDGGEPISEILAQDLLHLSLMLLNRLEHQGPVLTEADVDMWTQ